METSKKTSEWISRNIATKDKDGREVPTKAFGVISFKGAPRKSKAKFVQLSDATKPYLLYELLRKWNLNQPQIVISVTGGAKLFNAEEHVKKKLASGLIKIAQSPGTWILTVGTNTGITKFVGECLQGISESMIGVPTWGVIKNANCLYPTQENPLGGTFNYEVSNSFIEHGASLDYNHSHFLLVDDLSTGKFGRGFTLLNSLIKHCSKELNVPSVMLVIEGGYFTINNVLETLSITPPIPVIIVKGSGRVADVIAYVKEYSEQLSDEVIMLKLKTFLKTNLPELDEKKTEEAFEKIKQCVTYKHMTIFDADEEESFDKSILNAVLNRLLLRKR